MKLPVVLITGQLLTDAVWQPILSAFDGHEIIFANHREDDSIAAFADRLLADAPPKFILVGHAMGGFVAFDVMRRAAQRVEKLVLIATLASADGPAQTARRQGYIDLVANGHFDQLVEERLPMLFPEPKRQDERLIGLARQMAADTGVGIFLAQQRAIMTRIDSRPYLARINVPTLLIWGEGDGITNRAQHEEIAAEIARAKLVTLANVGHLPMVEAPSEMIALLRGFIG